MAAAAISDFQIMRIWPFRRVESVMFVLCTNFGSNICNGHCDSRSYASDVHLMTSRGHLRMAVMRLPIKHGAYIFIQSEVIDIFPKLKVAAAAILDLLGQPWDHPLMLIPGAYVL